MSSKQETNLKEYDSHIVAGEKITVFFFKLTRSDCFRSQEREDNSLLWVWEGEYESRQLSVLDPDWSTVKVERKHYTGPMVRCVTKVDDHIWVGNMVGSDKMLFTKKH